jgi:hypothetical protein
LFFFFCHNLHWNFLLWASIKVVLEFCKSVNTFRKL